jgi:hypothetical protein
MLEKRWMMEERQGTYRYEVAFLIVGGIMLATLTTADALVFVPDLACTP